MRRLIQTAAATADGPLELIAYQDDDDPAYPPSVWDTGRDDFTTTLITGPRIMQSDTWNQCAKKATGDIYMQCDDDVRFSSGHWDTIITEAINQWPDKLGVVWGMDGVHPPPNCATQLFVHKRWVEVLGYFTPPYFTSDYSDTWIYDLGCRIGRTKYLDNVYTEHMHPLAGKATWDTTYQERLTRHAQQDPAQLFANLEPERVKDAKRLQNVIDQERA